MSGRVGAPRPGGELAGVVADNIAALLAVKRDHERIRSPVARLADGVTRFAGSMWSVAAHALLFGSWIVANLGLIPGIPAWDPYPFVMLAMWASVEAIFLSTFILVSQNRQAELAERRAELDLQVNLLAEHEVTRLLHLVERIARTVGAPIGDGELEELKRDVDPQAVMREMRRAEEDRPAP
jgi:uncharacterized membrane protein